MKKYLWILTLAFWIITACAPQPASTPQSLLPNDDSYPNTSYPNDSYPNENSDSTTNWTPAQQAAITALSQSLSLPPGQITLISTEAVEWPNGCMGIQKIGVMCTQAIVPGYKIVLQANGVLYEFHTDDSGKQIVQVGEVAPAGTVEEMVIKQLAANLGLKESDISVVSNSEVDFPDSCLGVAMPNIMCAQMVTSGKIIVLEAKDIQYEYHVTSNGSQIQPATLALIWTREGGIAGFCDSMTVFLSGEVYGNQCKSQPNETTGTITSLLSTDEREQFNAWFKELGQVNLNASDPEGVSDRMEVTLTFYGSGKGTLKKSEEQELFLWAQNLFQKLYS